MALKQITWSELRKLELANLEDQIKNFRCTYNNSSIHNIANTLNSNCYTYSSDIQKIVKQIYGYSDDKNNEEFYLASLLTIYSLLRGINTENCYMTTCNKRTVKVLLSNAQKKIEEYFPEYKISGWLGNEMFLKYEVMASKVIIDNLKDINVMDSKPIIEILKHNKSELELIGYISKINANLETKWPKTFNLNKTDTDIIKKAKSLAGQLINKVDSAKGHTGKSDLSVKDIAHNYALLVSLIFKLLKK